MKPASFARICALGLAIGGEPSAAAADERAAEMAGVTGAVARFGVAGRGATICIVDTGIDVSHPAFVDDTGHTRIASLFDVESERVWSAAEIDAARASPEGLATVIGDAHGHGTAVASIAAAIAPGASLVAVRAVRAGVPGLRDDDLLRGVRSCFEASVDPARTVVVVSSGSHDGAHDGTELLEVELERLASEQARAIVVAAGEEDGSGVHASGRLREGEGVHVTLRVPAPIGEAGERYVALVLVTHGSQPVAVGLRSPDGTETRRVLPGEMATADHSGGRLVVDGARASADRPDPIVYLTVTGGGDGLAPLAGGPYEVEIEGPGQFDLWIAGRDVGAALTPVHLDGALVDASESIAIPGTAASVLTVGAVVSRARVATAGAEIALDGAVEGLVAPFSPRGPTRAGDAKPDLVAPGGYVLAALSRSIEPADAFNLVAGSAARLEAWRIDGDRIALAGTSFAAPVVAGVVALAMESAPWRGAADRDLLLATARPRGPMVWDASAGAGLVDAEAFLDARARLLGGEVPLASIDPTRSGIALTRERAWPGDSDVRVVGRVVDRSGVPRARSDLSLLAPDGAAWTLPIENGFGSIAVSIGGARAGQWWELRASADGEPLAPALLAIDGGGRRTPGGGGCAVGLPRERREACGPVVAALVAAFFALIRARQRARCQT